MEKAENLAERESKNQLLNAKRQIIDESLEDVELTDEDKQKLDEWFLGQEVYKKRMKKLGENPTQEG